ncbi:metal-dependent hydrolase family protein [Nocardioides insulae]|uniref:metal-dependent hydrolase family protein n=1 Tax=Nocardioides insulae TaxID=394734 RepID=UPI0003FA02A8|nr:amidohydrolase family protein [Nocardioides insulae]
MSGSLLVQGSEVLDVASGEYREADVLCVDGRVAEVGKGLSAPEDVRVVDARGRRVLPGLIDCHVHVLAFSGNLGEVLSAPPTYVAAGAVRNMGAMLDRGFTTVRDTGGADYGLARAWAHGMFRGPRLIYGGKAMSQTGGHGDKREIEQNFVDDHPCCSGTGRVVDGVDAVRKAVREEMRRGAHHLKLHASGGISSLGDEISSTQYSMGEMRAAVEEAEAAGRYVTVHAYPPRAIARAVEAGVRCVEHGNLLDDETVALMRDRGTFLVPTLVTYSALMEEGRRHGLPQASWEKISEVLDSALAALELADRAGLKIAYGSDLLGGMQRRQNEEFRIRGEVQKPIDVVRAATLNAAELIQLEGEVGTLDPGAWGDMIVVDGDPLEDIGVLAEPSKFAAVIQRGSVVRGAL